MKPIKIVDKNIVKIHEALKEVNGKATSHTFWHFRHIEKLVDEAEKQFDGLGLPKKLQVGAKVKYWSGDAVPNAYKWARKATLVEIERRSSGWFLNEISEDLIHQQPPKPLYMLTADQDQEVVRRLRESYWVAA